MHTCDASSGDETAGVVAIVVVASVGSDAAIIIANLQKH